MRKRKPIGICETGPFSVLALPAVTAMDMRTRKRLKAETEKTESITTGPTCEDNIAVDKGQCTEHVEIHSTLKIKKTNMSRKRSSNVIECDNGAGILANDALLVGSSSTFPTDDIEPSPVKVIAPSSKWKNNKKAIQSEISENVNEATNECKIHNPSQTENADIPPDHEAGCDGPVSVVVKKYGRRKKKVRSPSKIDQNLIQENRSTELSGKNRSDDAPVGDSLETLSGGCPKDVDEKVLVQGQGSPIQVKEDVRVEKVIDDCAVLHENEGSMVMNNAIEKVTEGCFSKDKESVTNSEEIIINTEEIHQQPERADLNDVLPEAGESRILPEDISLDDECVEITPEVPLETSVSDPSRNSNNDASQVNGDMLSPGRSLVIRSRKKLLVLDLNGLIADIIRYIPEQHTPDIVIAMKAVFKRPFYEDFLQFCFARFNVGVWSSRAKINVRSVVDFLLGDAKKNLLFCWDQSHCTQTGFFTVENRQKPLLAKKLRKLWEKYEPDLPWKLGEYNETNTLMLDDSPYKALFNPPHTAIFPPTYAHTDKADNSLGPGGALRIYLEGLADAEDVQEFVKEHPFGQRPITERNASWRFYQKVLETGLISPEKGHSKCSIDELEGRQGIPNGQVDLDSSKKTLVLCAESHEQKASDSSSMQVLLDTDRPHQRTSGAERIEETEPGMQTGKSDGKQLGIQSSKGDFNSGNKALDSPVEFCERRANGSPRKQILHDSDRPHQRREVRRGEGDPGIQNGEGDSVPAKKNLDLCDDSLEQRTCSSPRWSTLCDTDRPHERRRGFERKEESDQGIQRGRGDFDSMNKALDSRPESRERRASGSPRWHMLRDTDRLHQKRMGFERREKSEQGIQHSELVGGQAIQSGKRAFDFANKDMDSRARGSPRRHMFYDTDKPHWRRWGVDRRGEGEPGIQSGKGDLDYTNNNPDSRSKSCERRASGSPRRHALRDTHISRWRRWGVDRRGEGEPGIQSGKGDLDYTNNNLDSRSKSRERRASGSPRRHTLRDTDIPHRSRGVERRDGKRNSDLSLQPASNFIRFDDANRQDNGRKIQNWGGGWNQPYRDTDKHPVSEDQMASGDSHEYSSFDIRSSDWSSGRGSDWSSGRGSDRSRGSGSDWSRGSGSDWSRGRGSDWSRGRGSDWSSGRGSDWSGGRGSDWSRGRGSDWNRGRGSNWSSGSGDWNRASQDRDKRPVPYEHNSNHHSSGFTSFYSQRIADQSRGMHRGRGDWKRTNQPMDQRPVSLDKMVGGFSYNNRCSTPSFHWRAYG